MAWTAPANWTAGETVTATKLNQQVRDNARYLKGLDGGVAIEAALAVGTASAPAWTLDVVSPDSATGGIRVTTAGFAALPLPGAISNAVAVTARGLNVTNNSVTLSSGYRPNFGMGAADNAATPLIGLRNSGGPAIAVEAGAILQGYSSSTGAGAAFSGSVGLGTSAPSRPLHVHSTTADNQLYLSSVGPSILLGNNAAAGSRTVGVQLALATATNHYFTGTSAGDGLIFTQAANGGTAGPLRLGVNSATQVVLGSNGSTVGVRLSPTWTLDVKSPDSATGGIRLTTDGYGSLPSLGSIADTVALTARGFNLTTDGVTLSSGYQPGLGVGLAMGRATPALSIRNTGGPALAVEAGNVGIGIASPLGALHVCPTSTAGLVTWSGSVTTANVAASPASVINLGFTPAALSGIYVFSKAGSSVIGSGVFTPIQAGGGANLWILGGDSLNIQLLSGGQIQLYRGSSPSGTISITLFLMYC